ncbi:MAG: hypothetical protein AB8B60_03980 [Sulfitobacter sp.]
MPKIFRFYITHCAIGFGVSALFIAALLYFNVANLWHLISTSDIGLMALAVFWVLNGIVFAGVQTGVAIMLMADDNSDDDRGGNAPERLIPVRSEARKPL